MNGYFGTYPLFSMKKALILILALAVVAAIGYSLTTGSAQKELNVLSWDYYIGPNTIADFEKEFGAKVTYELIKSNEEALARMKSNPGVYDVAVISDYMVDILRKEDGMQPLDTTAISNLGNIDPSMKGGYFDPNMEFSVPYAYGTAGFAVNTKYVTAEEISWKELSNPLYKGKVAVMDDMRYVIGSALMELGFSPNSVNPAEIDAAVALIQSVVPNIVKFTADSPVDLMVSEGAWVSYGYSGDSLQMHQENEAIEYKLPAYGALKFLDNMVIPTGAPHASLAHEWINFILRPEVSAAITNEIQYGNPNAAALDAIDEEVRTNAAVFPSAEALGTLQYVEDVGEDLALYDKAWEKIKQ